MTHLNEKLDDTHKKVEEMHAILLQAKGARSAIVGLGGCCWAGVGVGGEVCAVMSKCQSSNRMTTSKDRIKNWPVLGC